MSKKKKTKKRPRSLPPLGLLDRLLYWSAMALIVIGMLGSILAFLYHNTSAFHKEPLTACSFDYLWGLLFPLVWSLFAFVQILLGPYRKRIPLFGRKDVTYGPPVYRPVYPLFRKGHPKASTAKRHQLPIALISLLVCLFMYALSFYGRTSLHPDGSLTKYGPFNCVTTTYTPDQITNVTLETFTYPRRLREKWHCRFVIRTADGKHHRFTDYDFTPTTPNWRDPGWTTEYQAMLDMKEMYGSLVSTDTSDLHAFMEFEDLSPEETALLCKLFGIVSP